MPLHFAYSERLDRANLCQGDVLERTKALDALIKEIHPAFHRADNIYFQILTQTCDLVCDRLKTEYITICPVRPLSSVLGKALKAHVRSEIAGVPIGIERERATYQQFLERLFNNNAQGYFYLDKAGAPFSDDCCALTKLTIALKSSHYAICKEAKILQLNDTFQAKLGWLVGHSYSRVGTPDYSKVQLQEKIKQAFKTSVAWVPGDKERGLVLAKADELGAAFTLEQVPRIIKGIETKKDRALATIRAILEGLNGEDEIPGALLEKIMKKMANDPGLAEVFGK